MILIGLVGFVGHPKDVLAEVSDRDYEVMLKERKRDFDSYVARRKKSSEQEVAAALELKKSREAYKLAQEKILLEFRKTMVRYSMEETEARDQAYEKVLANRTAESDLERTRFVERQKRRRLIEERSPKVDPYEEFEIDLTVPPETKVSSSGLSGETIP